jgi:hypothetical protein
MYASVEALTETYSHFFLQGIRRGHFFRMVYDKNRHIAVDACFNYREYDMAHRILNDFDGGACRFGQ